jgi:hypothetical protein
MALGSTQPLAEMCTRSISWGVKTAGAVRLTTLPPFRAIVTYSGKFKFLEPSGHLGPVTGLIYLYYDPLNHNILVLRVTWTQGVMFEPRQRQTTVVINSLMGFLSSCKEMFWSWILALGIDILYAGNVRLGCCSG